MSEFFSQSGFMPHGHCYLWLPSLVALHVSSDLLIGLSYLVISLSLLQIVRTIRLPFSGVMLAFGTFIASCGMTHFMEVWTLWHPDYWLSGLIKLVTATASIAASVWLIKIRPQVLDLARSARLAEDRRSELEKMTQGLESRVQERTSELERSQALARASETRLRTVVDGLPSLVSCFDREQRYVFVNSTATEWFKAEQSQIIGHPVREILGDEVYELIASQIRQALDGESVVAEMLMPFRTGARFVHKTYTPIFGDDGKVETVVVLAHDVSERRQAFEAVKKSEREYRAIFELAGSGKVELDTESGQFIRVNRKFCEITGFQQDELLGRRIFDLVFAEDLAEDHRLAAEIFASSSNEFTQEKRLVRKDGAIIWVAVAGAVIRDENGRPVRSIATVQDITFRKNSEAAINDAKARAEEANRAKSTFIANMSHEIRTPLGAMLGFAELLLDDDGLNPDQENNLRIILRNGEQLYRIINEVLDISKIEANKMEIEKTRVHLGEVIEDVSSLLSIRAQQKGLRFEVTSDGPLPETIETDMTRFRQILLNVIGNAIKFTDKGFVEVTFRLKENDPSKNPSLEVVIQDSGPGITPEQASRLFKPFAQADSSTSRKFGGTGLGLYLSRRFAQVLGGNLILKQNEDRSGCTFVVTIDVGPRERKTFHPLLDQSEASNALPVHVVRGDFEKPGAQKLRNLQILVVDDSPDNLRLTAKFLSASGAEVEVLGGAEMAIEALKTKTFDVVIMDIQMPGMDGYEGVRQLRAMGYERPILALTAHAMKGERERCLQAGFDGYLVKPIDRISLIHEVRSHASL